MTPAVCASGCKVRIEVRIEPNNDDRYLVIEADSPDYFRRTDIQLEGDDSPTVHTLRLIDAPAGTYQVRATVQRVNDTVQGAPATLVVLGP